MRQDARGTNYLEWGLDLFADDITNGFAAAYQLDADGAELLAGDSGGRGSGYCHANTLLRISGTEYLSNSQAFQAEAFGNTRGYSLTISCA